MIYLKLVIWLIQLNQKPRTGKYWKRQGKFLLPTDERMQLSKQINRLRFSDKKAERVYRLFYSCFFRYRRAIKRRN